LNNYGSIKGYSGNTDFILNSRKTDNTGNKRYSETKNNPIMCIDQKEIFCSNQWVSDKVEALKVMMNDINIVII
jgi:hypothetical protein